MVHRAKSAAGIEKMGILGYYKMTSKVNMMCDITLTSLHSDLSVMCDVKTRS